MADRFSRRDFLRTSGVAGIGVALTGCTGVLGSGPPGAGPPAPSAAPPPLEIGYGPLVADPRGRLALPADFTYRVITEAGVTRLESGEPTPRNHDGTGSFRARGSGTVLVTNHEIREPFGTELPVPHLDGLTYDPGAAGGATVTEVDGAGDPVRSSVGIAGTSTNCAGGQTPWNTWLTCEETDAVEGSDGFQRDHGYVFEVDPFDRAANRDPRPIAAFGRFEHEAAAIDPERGDVYLTEDAAEPNGLLYRWQAPAGFRPGPRALGALGPTEGVLGALRATDGAGVHVPDLSLATEIGTTYAVEWVPVLDRDARDRAVRAQFSDGDVTRAAKLEGAWWNGRGAHIVSSYAREDEHPGVLRVHDGQVWHYDPVRATLTLELLFTKDPIAGAALNGPDNISISPYGGVVLAQDGEGAQHLIGATPSGSAFLLARNDLETEPGRNVEFTGPVYGPDQRTLFANIQEPGITFAITGPWRPQP